jgi:hypothetical protein
MTTIMIRLELRIPILGARRTAAAPIFALVYLKVGRRTGCGKRFSACCKGCRHPIFPVARVVHFDHTSLRKLLVYPMFRIDKPLHPTCNPYRVPCYWENGNSVRHLGTKAERSLGHLLMILSRNIAQFELLQKTNPQFMEPRTVSSVKNRTSINCINI